MSSELPRVEYYQLVCFSHVARSVTICLCLCFPISKPVGTAPLSGVCRTGLVPELRVASWELYEKAKGSLRAGLITSKEQYSV